MLCLRVEQAPRNLATAFGRLQQHQGARPCLRAGDGSPALDSSSGGKGFMGQDPPSGGECSRDRTHLRVVKVPRDRTPPSGEDSSTGQDPPSGGERSTGQDPPSGGERSSLQPHRGPRVAVRLRPRILGCAADPSGLGTGVMLKHVRTKPMGASGKASVATPASRNGLFDGRPEVE
jgi:hypothetical protein